MGFFSNIFILFIAVSALAVVLVTLYYFIYRRYINKEINNPSAYKRKIPSIQDFLAATIISVCIIFGILLCISAILNRNNINTIEPPICNYIEIDLEKNDIYANVYSKEHNEGYEKKVEVVNDVRFTYFLSKDNYDTYHPSFIIFAEYTGDEKILHNGVNGTFYYIDDELIGGYGYAGGDGKNTICIIGDASYECIFELKIAFYNTDDKADVFSEGAAAYEVLRMVVMQ